MLPSFESNIEKQNCNKQSIKPLKNCSLPSKFNKKRIPSVNDVKVPLPNPHNDDNLNECHRATNH